jgi:hypothetical protein
LPTSHCSTALAYLLLLPPPCSCTTRVTLAAARHWLYCLRELLLDFLRAHVSRLQRTCNSPIAWTWKDIHTKAEPHTPLLCGAIYLQKRICCAERSIGTIAWRDPAYYIHTYRGTNTTSTQRAFASPYLPSERSTNPEQSQHSTAQHNNTRILLRQRSRTHSNAHALIDPPCRTPLTYPLVYLAQHHTRYHRTF